MVFTGCRFVSYQLCPARRLPSAILGHSSLMKAVEVVVLQRATVPRGQVQGRQQAPVSLAGLWSSSGRCLLTSHLNVQPANSVSY